MSDEVMSTFITVSEGEWMNDGTIIMDDGSVAYTTIIQTTDDPPLEQHCIVCRKKLSGVGNDIYTATTSTSNSKLYDVLINLLPTQQNNKHYFTDSRICSICFLLLERADELKTYMDEILAELKSISSQVASHTVMSSGKSFHVKKSQLFDAVKYKESSTLTETTNENSITDFNYPPLIKIEIDSTKLDADSKSNLVLSDGDVSNILSSTKDITCRFCPITQRFSNKQLLANHFDKVHSYMSVVMCKLCNQDVFGGIKHFLLHMASHHPDVQMRKGIGIVKVNYPNQLIKKKTNEDSSYKENVKMVYKSRKPSKFSFPTRINKKSYIARCPHCQKSLSSLSLQRHINAFHSNIKSYQCKHCPEKFKKRYHYVKHMKDTHDVEFNHKTKDIDCKVCGSLFYNQYTLTKHMEMVHENRRDYLCNICGLGYKTRSSLKIHLRRHSGSTPYTCNICGKSFIDSGGIKKHVRSVHNEDASVRLNDPLKSNLFVSVDPKKF